MRFKLPRDQAIRTIAIMTFILPLVIYSLRPSLATPSTVAARPTQDPEFRPIRLDDITVTVWDVTWDFVQVAFSDHLWREKPSQSYLGALVNRNSIDHEAYDDPAKMAAVHFFLPFIERDSFPKQNAVSKWTKSKIVIRVGWPWGSELDEAQENYMKSTIKDSLQTISSATGLDLQTEQIDDPDIVVVPADISLPNDSYKIHSMHTRHGINEFSWWFEDLIPVATEFSPETNQSVYGAYLSDMHNVIQKAYCILPTRVDAIISTRLIQECLLRSLGLPGTTQGRVTTLLDGNIGSERVNIDGQDARNPEAVIENRDLVSFKESVNSGSRAGRSHISEFDALMLNILYCGDIGPGFDKIQVTLALFKTNNCVTKYFQKDL